MTADVRAWLRRYWWRYVVAVFAPVLVSAGVSIGLCVAGEQAGEPLAVTTVLAGFLAACAYITTMHNDNKPHKWLRNAAGFGAAACFLPMVPLTRMAPSESAGLAFFAVGVVSIAGCALAGHAKVVAGDRIGTAETVASDLGARFAARANTARLEVDTTKVQIFKTDFDFHRRNVVKVFHAVCLLRNIRAVRVEYLKRSESHRLPGNKRLVLELTPGQAVVLDTSHGQWIFPTNQGYDAVEVISAMRKKYGRPNLDTFLPRDP